MSKTNEQMFEALLSELHPMEIAILRERLVSMMEVTRKQILKDPEPFNNPFVSAKTYLHIADKVEAHLGFD